MQKDLPPKLEIQTLRHLATEQLVELIIEQAKAIEQLKIQSNRTRTGNREALALVEI